MLDFVSDCVSIAAMAWIGSIVIAVATIAVMVAGLIAYGWIKARRDDE